jgi:D-tyrosyl-tRNA(Tyr) deacylase
MCTAPAAAVAEASAHPSDSGSVFLPYAIRPPSAADVGDAPAPSTGDVASRSSSESIPRDKLEGGDRVQGTPAARHLSKPSSFRSLIQVSIDMLSNRSLQLDVCKREGVLWTVCADVTHHTSEC